MYLDWSRLFWHLPANFDGDLALASNCPAATFQPGTAILAQVSLMKVGGMQLRLSLCSADRWTAVERPGVQMNRVARAHVTRIECHLLVHVRITSVHFHSLAVRTY